MSDDFVRPIPPHLLQKLKDAGVGAVHLEFSGGSDEGYLDVSFMPAGPRELPPEKACDLYDEVYKWVYDAYDYSGAGDGTPYGDDVVYDLKNGTWSHTSWYTVRHEDCCGAGDLEELYRSTEETG